MDVVMYEKVKKIVEGMPIEHFVSLNLCAQYETDPRGRDFSYDKVKELFTEEKKLLHPCATKEVKKMLIVVLQETFAEMKKKEEQEEQSNENNNV